jgi:hypothetical protein
MEPASSRRKKRILCHVQKLQSTGSLILDEGFKTIASAILDCTDPNDYVFDDSLYSIARKERPALLFEEHKLAETDVLEMVARMHQAERSDASRVEEVNRAEIQEEDIGEPRSKLPKQSTEKTGKEEASDSEFSIALSEIHSEDSGGDRLPARRRSKKRLHKRKRTQDEDSSSSTMSKKKKRTVLVLKEDQAEEVDSTLETLMDQVTHVQLDRDEILRVVEKLKSLLKH